MGESRTKPLSGWEFYIDRGGTFTDVVARRPDGTMTTYKLLSSDEAPLVAIRHLMGLSSDEAIPPSVVKLGSTVGTNALLERKGRRLGLVVTKGFGDLLNIGYQNRRNLFSLDIEKSSQLYDLVFEVDERLDAQGVVVRSPRRDQVERGLNAILAAGIDAVVVVFLHSYLNSDHEELVGQWARDLGFGEITLSSEVTSQIKVVSRGDTAVVDGYLTPVVGNYLARLQESLEGSEFQVIQSSGGLVTPELFRGKDSLLSGPAGGVVGYARAAREKGIDRVIGFDMGGTSTDVSRYDGDFEMVYETEKAGIRIKAPMINIETVAAGGGSIIQFDSGRLQVGPESAGADPGPICYGRGGTDLTVTDANLFLGRIAADYFDKFSLHIEPVVEAFAALAREIEEATGREMTPREVAAGAIEIANQNMVAAIQVISVACGYDPREYALATFGGAGGQHACALARELGCDPIVIHPYAGVLSAAGIGLADVKMDREQTVNFPFPPPTWDEVEGLFDEMAGDLEEILSRDSTVKSVEVSRLVDLRYHGQSSELTVPYHREETGKYFEDKHRQHFGHLHPDRSLEMVALRVQACGVIPPFSTPEFPTSPGDPQPDSHQETWFAGEMVDTPIYLYQNLGAGQSLSGPAIVIDGDLTVVIEPGFTADLDERGVISLHREEGEARRGVSTERDPVLLEVFYRLFSSVAEQMGESLRNTAFSTNIKERLDFSCAIFDPSGDLVANAAHIPVHLGAMSEAVKGLIESGAEISAGDVYVTNNPFCGGSHLPDVTVITPVVHSGEIAFFVANRGHHADIGGIVPGSMPAFSTTIEEEGVLIDNFCLVKKGQPRYGELDTILTSGPYPVRDLAERKSDLEAQVAANVKGVSLLEEVMAKYGSEVVTAYMGYIQAAAEEKMRALLSGYEDGTYTFEDFLDPGLKIALTIEITGDRARLDFTGTSPQMEGNLNANQAITKSAILYVFRTLLDQEIPLNSGCLAPLEIHIPEGTLLNPQGRVAVVGGNVETSQRICDVLLGALGGAAASQGTMNNFTFGDDTFGYYETICGGSGAGPGFAGQDGVHTHMTNTRITDPEIMEQRYPVRLDEFSLRPDSGGAGTHWGGRGVRRKVTFLKSVQVSLLTERRRLAPYGLDGGKPGQMGKNTYLQRLERRGEEFFLPRDLGDKVKIQVSPGDGVVIETPGGGGYGPPQGHSQFFPEVEQEVASHRLAAQEILSRRREVAHLRQAVASGRHLGPTTGLAPGFAQANLVVLPGRYADDFRDFCRHNHQPCPLLEETDPGDPYLQVWARGADIRREIPQYLVHRKGRPRQVVHSLVDLWEDDWVAFLLGCSFTFEGALLQQGIPVRHIEMGTNVPMYTTLWECKDSGPFSGPLVVSMRPIPRELVDKVVSITEGYPDAHGAPIHWGDPEELGIEDLASPDFGDPVEIHDGEIPVFWACGVTPQVVLAESDIEIYCTHRPGHMMVTDVYRR